MTRRAQAGGVAVLGARPNFVKLLPVLQAFRQQGLVLPWIHTGHHGAPGMDRALRRDLGLSEPLQRLHAPPPGAQRVKQMAAVLLPTLKALPKGWVLGFGDVDSTAAAALASRKLRRPFVHVEAGLRADDPSMPEEQNRVLADHLAARLYAAEPGAMARLLEEGVKRARIRSPGNVMADALRLMRPRIERRARVLLRGPLTAPYVVVTLHRQANVDRAARLRAWIAAISDLGGTLPVVWPLHPRLMGSLGAATRRALKRARVRLVGPQPYVDFLALVSGARLVATDSGGLQVETALLGVPCLTLRDRTEHRLTLRLPTHRLLGEDPQALRAQALDLLGRRRVCGALPRAWDGHAAERLVADLVTQPPARGVVAVELPAGFALPVGF